ncbi:MAG: DUF1848 domain-containing protein [Ruminococcaceae bacterium]|nr:DUF1848 domain-containing protein [Oscillospiraceae bacterium]
MILSVSRRTDIPAFYSEWFFRRIEEGFVCVRNPMNARQVSRISLSRDVVDCIVFWTKNAEPILDKLAKLSGYDYYFQFTINDYDKETEPRIPELSRRLDTFVRLSEKLGRERVIWRYDPIIFYGKYTPEYHLKSFEKIASALGGYTEKCVFSFVDVYPSKNVGKLNALGFRQPSPEELDGFAGALSEIAKSRGFALATCAEAIDLAKHGIEHNSCIDKALIERITGAALGVGGDDQREHCRCVKCDDIGSYDTCPHGCIYCYANFRPSIVADKIGAYDVNSPLLCDSIKETDKVTDRPVRSYKRGTAQLTLDDI